MVKAQTFNQLPEYNENRQLNVSVVDRPDIPDGYTGVLLYDTGAINLIDLTTKQQIIYSGLPLMYEPSLNTIRQEIIFGLQNHIFTIDIITGMSNRISPAREDHHIDSKSGAYPTYSPDGQYVLYISSEIQVIDLETSEVSSLDIADNIRSISEIKWSPDGRWIVFVADAGFQQPRQLYLIPADCIETNQCVPQLIVDNLTNPRSLIWHPNSQKIGFVDLTIGIRGSTDPSDTYNDLFYTVDINSLELEPIIDNPNFDVFSPAWSPNGSQLAFLLVNFGDETYQRGLYSLPSDGGEREFMFPLGGLWTMQWHDSSFEALGIDVEALQQANED